MLTITLHYKLYNALYYPSSQVSRGLQQCLLVFFLSNHSKEVCVDYKVRYKKRLGIYLCKFPRKFEPEDYCDTADDGTLVCNIQSPNFNEDQ